MTDRKRAYLRAYMADLPESIREKYRLRDIEHYRAKRDRFFAAGLTCKGTKRLRAPNMGQSKDRAAYVRTWRAAKRISASQTYPTAGTSAPPIDGVEG